MNKNLIIYILFACIILLIFSQFYSIHNRIKITNANKQDQLIYKMKIDELQSINKSIWSFFFLQQNSKQLSVDINEESLYRNSFVLMITDHHCMDCILFALEQLRKMHSDKYNQILILYDFENIRRLNIVKNKVDQLNVEYDIKLTKYNFKDSFLDLSVPYYATVSEDLCLKNIFIPEKQKPELTNDYLTHSNIDFSSQIFFEK